MAIFPLANQVLLEALPPAILGQSRHIIHGVEHQTVALPPDLIRPDGSLDLYPDVVKFFQPVYDKGLPSLRCGRWVGHIPLNDRFALEVGTRVPVGTLERLVVMGGGGDTQTLKILDGHEKAFAAAEHRPDRLLDVIADRFLDAFDQVVAGGFLRTYQQRTHVGSSPSGRLMPFQTAVLSARSGRPVAMSSAFHRTADYGPNRVLRLALEKLLARSSDARQGRQKSRAARLRRALRRLEEVSRPTTTEISSRALAAHVRQLPMFHEAYADALGLAAIVIQDKGIAIRSTNGAAILPSILIDMSGIFENYIRRVLANGLATVSGIVVKDGNIEGKGGARRSLYDPFLGKGDNPTAKPDVVIEKDGKVILVIDAKYKPAPKGLPDRDDTDQVVVYGARYDTNRVMVLHASRSEDQPHVELCGSVGSHQVYSGAVNLEAKTMPDEELAFVKAINSVL